MSLDGQRVLITGADSTARVIAETFQRKGARVFTCDIRPEAVESIREDNPEIHSMVANVGNENDVNELVAAALAEFGGIDVLVNVVGVAGPTKPVEQITTEEWRQTLDINLSGVFYTARAVIPGMKERTLVQPQELADMVVFLCSDQARHITGQLIGVDGNQEWED